MSGDTKVLRETITALRRQEKDGESRLKLIRETIANIQRILDTPEEAGRPIRPAKPSRRKARTAVLDLNFSAPPAPPALPSVTEAILKAVNDAPGRSASELITMLFDVVATESTDKRKLLSTRIGQLEKKGRIRKADGLLFPAVSGNGTH